MQRAAALIRRPADRCRGVCCPVGIDGDGSKGVPPGIGSTSRRRMHHAISRLHSLRRRALGVPRAALLSPMCVRSITTGGLHRARVRSHAYGVIRDASGHRSCAVDAASLRAASEHLAPTATWTRVSCLHALASSRVIRNRGTDRLSQ